VDLEPSEGFPLTVSFFADDSVSLGWKTSMLVVATNTPKGLDTFKVTAKIVGSASAPGGSTAETAMFMIVPNPTAGDADIYIAPATGELGLEYTLSITDAAGKEVRRESGRFGADGIRSSMRKGELPTGVYYVSVTTSKGRRSHAVSVTR
jgi:hypothetical protein